MGFWGRLAAGLAGGAANFAQPGSGIGVTRGLLDEKYNRALEQFNQRKTALGGAAQLEQANRGFNQGILSDLAKQQQFGATYGLQREELGQKGADLNLRTKILENEMQQKQLDRALAEKRISIEQYQAASQRMNAETQRQQANDPMRYLGPILTGMGGFNRGMNQNQPQPSAPISEMRINAAVAADPVLSTMLDDNGEPDLNKIANDPVAASRYQQLIRSATGVNQDINLGPKQPDMMAIIQMLQGMGK